MKTKPKFIYARFLGKNGRDWQLAKAMKELVVGRRYRVYGASGGQSSSSIGLKTGWYNSVMFDVPIERLIEYFPAYFTRCHIAR